MQVHIPESVLVAGSGSIARRHVRNLLDLGVGEILVWTGRSCDEPEFMQPRVRVVSQLPDDCPGVAIVANDTSRHVETAFSLAARGVHMLVEKPLSATVDSELQQLLEVVAAERLVAKVAYNLRFLAVFREIESVVRPGLLGDITMVDIEAGQWLPDWRPGTDYLKSYSAHSSRGGGVDLDLSHEVDYMCMLFGRPDQWSVSKRNTGVLGIDAPDVFDAVYDYSDGPRCTVHLDYLSRPVRRGMRIQGTNGLLQCDLAARRLIVEAAGDRTLSDAPELFDVPGTYTAELVDFFAEVAGAVTGGLLPDLREGATVLRLLTASV